MYKKRGQPRSKSFANVLDAFGFYKEEIIIFYCRSNNPVLLGFLIGIQKQGVTEPGLTDLISRALTSAPDLVIPFVSRLELNLEHRESQQWGDNITFITEVPYN